MGSGPRYSEWTHLRVVGDRDAANAYVPYARKLLGFVMDEAQRNGLGVHKVTREFDDGTIVIAEKHGDIPRVTIVVTPGGEPKIPVKVEGDYVVWARTNDAYPDGINATKPQQILQSTKDKGWRVFSASAGFPGNADGAYGGSFPEGLRRAGNIDWVSERGERISWYGPSSRAWLDGYVNPGAQYGKFVFMMGLPILDVDQYILDSDPDPPFDDRWVLGAGIGKFEGTTYLYVAHSVCTDGPTDMTPIPDGDGRISDPYRMQNAPLSFYRYALTMAPDSVGTPRYSVVPHSREFVGGYGMMPTCAPWTFNNNCTKATSIRNPGGMMPWLLHYEWPGYTVLNMPGSFQYRDTVNFHEDWGLAQTYDALPLSATQGGPAVPIASEWNRDNTRAEVMLVWDALMNPKLILGATEVPLWEIVETGAQVEGTKRWAVHLNPRDNIAVFIAEHRIMSLTPWGDVFGPSTGDGLRLEVWLDGVRVRNQQLYDIGSVPNVILDRLYVRNNLKWEPLDGEPVYPQFFVDGVTVQYQPLTDTTIQEFSGANVTYTGFPHAAGSYFGTFDRSISPGSPSRLPTPINDIARDGFSANRSDFDGYHSIAGVAAHKGTAVVSCAIPSTTGHTSFGYIHSLGDPVTLPGETGISGEYERYHPVWIVGVPLESSSPP